MIVECPGCNTIFPVDPKKVPTAGIHARCSVCSDVFFVSLPEPDLEVVEPEGQEIQEPEAQQEIDEGPGEGDGSAVGDAEEPLDESEPTFGEAEQTFDEDETAFGKVEPTVGASGPTFGEAEQTFDEPEAAFGETEVTFDEPETVLGETEVTFDEPETAFGETEVTFDEPETAFGETEVTFDEPETAFGETEVTFDEPEAAFGETEVTFDEPETALEESDLALPESGFLKGPEETETAAEDWTKITLETEEDVLGGTTEALGEAGTTLDGAVAGVVEEIPEVAPPSGPLFGKRDPTEKAKRLARVLVSDIILYNPDRHYDATESGRVKEEFEEEIQKSWDEYVEQVGDEIADSTDFFTDALNEILAKGEKIF